MLSVASPQDGIQPLPSRFSSNETSDSCRTCCLSCSEERIETRFLWGSASASFEHLLAAGSLVLSIVSGGCSCFRRHAGDGFHTLHDMHSLRPYLAQQDVEILHALSFLTGNRFIMVTYALTPSETCFVMRIYLIPYDMPGNRGTLRIRDEDKVMKPARTYLKKVLSRVSRRPSIWNAEYDCYDQSLSEERFLPIDGDGRSLSQIFNDLTTAHDGSTLPNIPWLRSGLYEYQEESVAKMLAMETPSRIINDPLYIPINDIEHKLFYLQPTTMEVLLQCPRRYQARGGVLCEELGTGKTVMTLALVLATLDVLPDLPEQCNNEILTPLAYRHFPQDRYTVLRKLSGYEKHRQGFTSQEQRRNVPTLVEILCDYARKHPSAITLRSIEDSPLCEPIRRNAPFFFQVLADDLTTTSVRQRRPHPPRLTYLSTATLIVVPVTLQAQWSSEILKHCSSSIRILVMKSRNDFPSLVALASDYDIILATYNLISNEAIYSKNLSSLDAGYTCRCPEFRSIRVPDCSCPPLASVSPLLQIRWKRLVRDEGHNAASRSTELNHFLRTISAERKWIITGTPTANLLGLNFGSVTDDDIGLDGFESEDPPVVRSNALSLRSVGLPDQTSQQTGESGETTELDSGGLRDLTRAWSKADRVDLRKLGSMLSDFLGVLPFAVESESFSNLVINGLMDKSGPLPGTRRILEQVMSANMVRHRVEDVERHVRLPPLHEEVVLLDLEEYGQMTYNVLLSFVVVNAVDSERKDMDYLFHPSKAVALTSTIENLSHSLFWRFDENAFDYELPDNIHRAENAIIHARERGQPEEDIKLVENAISYLRKALENRQFRDMQHGLEVPYRMHNAPLRIRQTWGLVHEPDYAADDSVPFLVYPSYALELRSAVLRQPLIKEDSLAMRAELLRSRNRALGAFVEAMKPRADRHADSKSSSGKKRRRDEVQIDRVRLKTARRTATVDSKEKLQELHEEFRKAQKRLKAEAMEEDLDDMKLSSADSSLNARNEGAAEFSTARDQLLRGSSYAHMRVGNSTSSKLNYILEEVRKYSGTEKFLIFSSQPFNLVHISEGLDLMGVKYLHFMQETSKVKGKGFQRDQWLTTFETSETYRVFLMELKYGARGLNIVSASRVIFCEPVWRADVESQAIKRVHRIGQTRPVTVKTLAIRWTFEEYMIQRRRDFKGSSSKLPGLTEEWGVRNYLQNPVFLENPPQITVNLDFPLVSIRGSDASVSEHELGAVDASVERPEHVRMGHRTVAFRESMKIDDTTEQPSPKRVKVHFD